ncbi:hypothetical protein XELAEV_18016335mg [Xenopus laevis]|uniref:Uncharacterized protein n=1 Tax=Xenopus laevis TaxID=8355 RepID=A0A974DJT2_XENLA|nr:hypothetical protein XELAEV_18016335mg [Xenopus laevis]
MRAWEEQSYPGRRIMEEVLQSDGHIKEQPPSDTGCSGGFSSLILIMSSLLLSCELSIPGKAVATCWKS